MDFNKKLENEKFIKLIRPLILPVVVLVILAVALLWGRVRTNQAAAPQTSSVPESTLESSELMLTDFATYGLQKNAIPQINALVEKYQEAKTTGNAALMYRVFGRNDTDGYLEMESQLQDEMAVYEKYQDTVCYVTKGLEEGTYIVFISSYVKFKGIDTPAPMLTWAYVVEDALGRFHMKEPNTLTQAENARIDEIARSEDVRVLDSQMRKELADLVGNDHKLAALYSIWADNVEVEETSDDLGPISYSEEAETVGPVDDATVEIESETPEETSTEYSQAETSAQE